MSSDAFDEDRLASFEWSDERLWPQFEKHLRADPTALALIDAQERAWSRAQLADLAAPLSEALEIAGIGRGHRVLFRAGRNAMTFAAALAVSERSAICCPYGEAVGEAGLARVVAHLGHAAHADPVNEREFSLTVEPPDLRSSDERDRLAALVAFTSGSTGTAKAVIHGSEALNYVTQACAVIAALDPDARILGAIPMDGAAGFTFTVHLALSTGRAIVLVDRWRPVDILDRIARFDCTWTTLVPTQAFTLVEAVRTGAWTGASTLRTLAVGGSPMTPELIADIESQLGATALRMFGLSECLAHCSNQPGFSREHRLSSEGHPFLGTMIHAFDASEKRLPPGNRGQAGVRGPSLFLGYAAGLGQGQEQFTTDGYYLTGDEIVVDEAGFVRVVGRIKDQIIRGGYNIDPAEVEGVLLRHPSIAQVVVVPVPHPKLGEQACAVCRLNASPPSITLEDIKGHLEASEVYQRKWPEHLVLVEAMATLPTGKIDKRTMTSLAVAEIARRTQKTPTE